MKMKRSMLQIRQWLLMCALCAAFVACKDDAGDPDTGDQVDVSNPNAVAKSLTVAGASLKTGNPPAPSKDPYAPSLYNEDAQQTPAFQGKSFDVDVTPASGDIAGVYLKVKGSDSYFDIPASSLKSGRLAFDKQTQRSLQKTSKSAIKSGRRNKQDHGSALEIAIPENLKPGRFCAEYCIYDAQKRVSNIVEICIDVVAFGGKNADFLTQHVWSEWYEYDTWDGEVQKDYVGVWNADTYDMELGCENGTSKTFTIEESWMTEYLYFTMANNGGSFIEASYKDKYMDWETSSCELGIKYKDSAELIDATGAWSYNDAKKEIILMFSYEEDGYTDVDYATYKVEYKDNLLYLKETDISGEWGIVFKKK